MKLKLTLILSMIILFTNVFAQKTKSLTGSKKPQLFGINFLLVDFNGASGIKDPGTGKGYGSVRNMSKGLGFSYWRGLTSTVDFSAKLNAILHDYNLIANGIANKTELGVELEPTINIRPMGDNAKLAPFLTTGVGVG